MAAPRSRAPLYLGVVAAGGIGYYLYSAGGSPKVAEKKFESDIAQASAKVKSEIPGRGKEVKKEGEKWATEAGAKLDSAANKTRAEFAKAEKTIDQYRQEGAKKIDAADRKVEEEAAKAKSGVSNWFGGK